MLETYGRNWPNKKSACGGLDDGTAVVGTVRERGANDCERVERRFERALVNKYYLHEQQCI